MPFGSKPQCVTCQTLSTTLWRKTEKGEIVCSNCYSVLDSTTNVEEVDKIDHSLVGSETQSSQASSLSSSTVSNNNNNNNGGASNGENSQQSTCVVTRKSARSKQSQAKTNLTKGKGRRIIFKKSATKAPTAVATPVTSSFIFYKGSYFQLGDIVSMVDVEGDVYYAQIRGLLQDQYCEKSATVTWLLPTQSSPKDRFDPATFIIGPEEEIPRKLECMEFVCHAPSEYFKSYDSPYSTISQKPELCYVWSRLRPQIKPIKKTAEDIF